ncbi:MAG: GAF domain-containing protein [Spirulina sp. SIO3F2]|nr:GAF domain-containing protein [Spirulina sp. SIO3F2]
MDLNILGSTADAVFVIDRAWQLRSLNSTARKFLKLPEATCPPLDFWRQVSQWLGTVFEQECQTVMRQQRAMHFEAFSPLGNCWLHVDLHPHPEGIVLRLQDVSERKQMEMDVLDRARMAAVITRVSRFVTHSHRINECLQQTTDVLVEDLDGAIAAIWLYNPQHNRLERQGLTIAPLLHTQVHNWSMLQSRTLSLSGSVIGTIGMTRRPIFDQLFPLEPASETPLQLIQSSSHAQHLFCNLSTLEASLQCLFFMGYPLVLDDRLIGVLALWTQELLAPCFRDGLGLLSDHLALDIERCRAQNALRSRPTDLLFRLANQMRNSLDLNVILETAVQEIRLLFEIDCCSYLWSWSEPQANPQQTASPTLIVSHEARAKRTIPSLGTVLTPAQQQFLATRMSQQQMLRLDATQATGAGAPLLADLGVSALLLLPLETRSSHIGAIVCTHSQAVRPWRDDEVELLQAVVNQLAVAIDQAELFAQTKAAALAAQTQAQHLERALQELRQTQSQLVQTEKMSSLGQMVAGIAHEINNPVNFISGNLGYTEDYVKDLLRLFKLYQTRVPQPDAELQALIEEVDLDFIVEDLPKTLTSMQVGAERIRQIVLSLRNFSRLDQAEMKPVDIHEGLDSTLLILHNRLKAQGSREAIVVQKHYGQLPLVECYAGQLNQVFMNILANAIDAMETQTGRRQIQITTTLLPSINETTPAPSTTQCWVSIEIADNGPGMSPETAAHIFDPFFTTKPVGKGTGLGLSISYQIVVDKHRGQLDCQSQPGSGTVFMIKIPLHPFSPAKENR